MNILIVSPYTINTPHYETELEIAQKHLNAGDDVKFIFCQANLLACDVNRNHNIFICMQCILEGKRVVSSIA